MSDHRGFQISVPAVRLKVEEVWPDGVPDHPTAEGVVEAMRKSGGGVGSILSSWNIAQSIEIWDSETGRTATFP